MKKKTKAKVLNNICLTSDVYSMWLETELAEDVIPGQFVGLYTDDRSMLLPRPISICETDKTKKTIRLVYRTVGKGTEAFTQLGFGDSLDILGILGNGYDINTAAGRQEIVLMAGGIGIPPMIELAHRLKEHTDACSHITAVVGYRDSQLFLYEDLKQHCDVFVSTDDGSTGYKGNVIGALSHYKLIPDIIYACGPMPMLRAVKSYARENDIPAYISLEERMACGVGACLGCVCRTIDKDSHSNVKNARICTDGPVFPASEVDI